MKIRKLLAATGVVFALTPAALAAVIMAAHPKDGSVINAIQEVVGTELSLNQLQRLAGIPPVSAPVGAPAVGEQAAAAGQVARAADGELARVITGAIDSTRVGYHLAELMQGDGADPFSGSSSAEVIAALAAPGDPVSPQRQSAASRASGGSSAIAGAIGGRAGSGTGGGTPGAAAGARGSGLATASLQGSDELLPPEAAAGGSGGGVETAPLSGSDELSPAAAVRPGPDDAPDGAAGAILPIELPVQQAEGSVEESVRALDKDRRAGPLLQLVQRGVLETPLPASLWLFLAAMVGLLVLGRGRTAG